jgi:hypothetical protein
MRVALVIEITGMDGDDGSRYPAGFGIPAHMIADLESFLHLSRKITGIRAINRISRDFPGIEEFTVLSVGATMACPILPISNP